MNRKVNRATVNRPTKTNNATYETITPIRQDRSSPLAAIHPDSTLTQRLSEQEHFPAIAATAVTPRKVSAVKPQQRQITDGRRISGQYSIFILFSYYNQSSFIRE
ncbi:unnamed protein product [Didymodactylos carnosus]|uniref:Uncharacterized protein n=1 Tax=Didymodactylos carnosus TaxID=1234261 RepID=A0A8S2G2T8_9BILA|nr:unnamed protein product [Didymodactylos carnosus]CAF4436774.1 unnamed protein product [Didymodactylos carnosus]